VPEEGPFWHLTEKPNWELDPTYRPLSAYGLPRPTVMPGLFVTNNPVYWSSWLGKGPIYAIRVHVPKEALPRPTYHHPEYFITNFAGVQVREIRSLAEAITRGREEKRRGINWWDAKYDGFGGVEDWWFYRVSDDELGEREGLDELKRAWREANPGFDNPDEYFRAKYR
jgi:hypothetical protein